MGNCKDCRHWNPDNYLCQAVDQIEVFPDDQTSPGDTDFKIAVSCNDDQGLDVGLKVGPLFGCVQYQFTTRDA
jgi:hypothetical protein